MSLAFRDARSGRCSFIGPSCGSKCLGRAPIPQLPGWNCNRKQLVTTEAVKLQEAKQASGHSFSEWGPSRHPGPHQLDVPSSSPAVMQPGTSERAVSRYLINAIMEAQSWQQLEVLALSHALFFNHIHVSALVCRLPKLVTPAQLPHAEKARFSRFLRDVSNLVSFRLNSFDPRAVANVLWAVSKLGYSPAPPLLNKFLFEAYVRMYDFNAQELANLSWALATLAAMGNRPVPMWLRKFTLAAVPRVAGLKPQELAHMVWALSKLCPPLTPASAQQLAAAGAVDIKVNDNGSRGRGSGTVSSSTATTGPVVSTGAAALQFSDQGDALPELVSVLTSHALASLPRFRSGELVMTVMALHRLDPSAGLRLLRQALPYLLRTRPGELSPQDLANLWLVLGKCAAAAEGLPEEQAHSAGASTRNNRQGSEGAAAEPSSSVVNVWGAARSSRTGAEGDGHAAAGRVYSIAPTRDASKGRSKGIGSEQLAREFGRHHLFALMEVTERSLQGFTGQGLCTVLVAWARLRLQPSDATMHVIFQQYRQVLPAQANFQCVAITMWAAARLQLRPEPQVMDLLMSCARLQLAAAKPCELVALVWALRNMLYRPSRSFFRRLGNRVSALVDLLEPHGVFIIVGAYTVFGEPLPAAVRNRALQVTAVTAALAAEQMRATAQETSVTMSADAKPGQVGSTLAATVRKADSLLVWPPCTTVRFFATLAGVGVPKPRGARRRAAAAYTLQCLRWRLDSSPAKRRALRIAMEGATKGKLGELSTDALCALLTSLSRLHLQPSAAFLKEVHKQAAARAEDLTPWQIGGLVTAMGALRSPPPADWLVRVLNSLEPQYEALTSRQLLGVLRGLGRLRYRPTAEWMRSYFSECMSRLDSFSAAHLTMFLHSLSALGVRLKGSACQQLQLVVYRKKRQANDKRVGEMGRLRGAGTNLKRSLCRVCTGLSGCAVC